MHIDDYTDTAWTTFVAELSGEQFYGEDTGETDIALSEIDVEDHGVYIRASLNLNAPGDDYDEDKRVSDDELAQHTAGFARYSGYDLEDFRITAALDDPLIEFEFFLDADEKGTVGDILTRINQFFGSVINYWEGWR